MARQPRPSSSGIPQGLEPLARAIRAMLSRSAATYDDKVDLLAGAFVVEAFRPYWPAGTSATEAYEALRRHDPELADTIDAIAPMLLARFDAREESQHAIAEVEEMLRSS